jgi:phospholipid-binding lipoprotein MlaA
MVMDYKKRHTTLHLYLFTLFFFSCTAAGQTLIAHSQDPYESFNRAMYHFNDQLDQFILKPVATIYNKMTPKPLNKGIANFFNNLDTLPTIANDLLQAKFHQAANDLWRLAINSTIGIIGFFDIATTMKLKRHQEDFGLTLARWGYKQSRYLVLPFFGPSTIRDGIGIPVDYFVFSIYPYIQPDTTRYGLYALGVVSRRAQLLQYQPVFDEAALDRYVFMRDAYLQRRAHQMEQNEST